MRQVATVALALAVSFGVASAATANPADKAAKAQAVINAYIDTHPEMIVDLSDVSGEYCFNTWNVNGSHMTHYAIDPSKTTEDMIDFVQAQSFIDADIDITKLPTLPTELGAMENGQWYYLPKGGVEPHHGYKAFPIALMVRATDIQAPSDMVGFLREFGLRF